MSKKKKSVDKIVKFLSTLTVMFTFGKWKYRFTHVLFFFAYMIIKKIIQVVHLITANSAMYQAKHLPLTVKRLSAAAEKGGREGEREREKGEKERAMSFEQDFLQLLCTLIQGADLPALNIASISFYMIKKC